MKMSEIGKFKPLLKGTDIKASELELIEKKKFKEFEIMIVEFTTGKFRIAWVYNARNRHVFELTILDFEGLMQIVGYARPLLKTQR